MAVLPFFPNYISALCSGGVVTEAQSTDSSGTVSLSIFPYLMEVNFWVKAENRLGTVSSDVVKTETECLSEFFNRHNKELENDQVMC